MLGLSTQCFIIDIYLAHIDIQTQQLVLSNDSFGSLELVIAVFIF